MSQITFEPASQRHLKQWDAFVARAVNGTLFHSRAFLSYHGEELIDTARWVVALKHEDVIALFSYTVQEKPDGRRIAFSPFGASYGGLVLKNFPSYNTSRNLVTSLIAYLRKEELDELYLTPPISCCAPKSLNTLTFAMLEQGFRSVNRDVSSVVPLNHSKPVWQSVTARARNHARKALANGVTVKLGSREEDFWVPMHETFSRHGTRPTHDAEQLTTLIQRVPEHIRLDVGYRDGIPVAGVGLFVINARVVSSFYLCHTSESKHLHGFTLTILESMERCRSDGFMYYDMGTSSVGMEARENIFSFKESFSAESYIRETFEWNPRK